MAGESGAGDPSVTPVPDDNPEAATEDTRIPERLFKGAHEYRFFQAVRMLQALAPERKPVGRFADPRTEAARFTSHQSLSYPPSEIYDLKKRPGEPPAMEVSFMGLTGPVGEMPSVFTAHVMERNRAKDRTTADFFDIFNHRMVSLFYRAWEKYRFTVTYERDESGGILPYLRDIVGIGTEGLQNRQAVDDRTLAYYAGLLSQKPRSAQALKQVLQDYFQVPVEVIQFVGAWRRLEESSQCCLDDSEGFGMVSTELGVGAVAGDEVWDAQSTVRLQLGPMPIGRYLEFLPNGAAYPALNSLLHFFGGLEFDFDVQLVLRREDAPGCCLGAEGETAPQLGWLTWVKSAAMDRDPKDTVYRVREDL